jgi:hypothetical protein
MIGKRLGTRISNCGRRLVRPLLRWHWHDGPQEWRLSIARFGKYRATVWPNGVWHTWDRDGIGGENGVAGEVWLAKAAAYDACIRQRYA